LNHCRWDIKPAMPVDSCGLGGDFSPLINQILYNRGLTEPSKLELFLNIDQRLLNDPLLLPDMPQALNRIYRALLSGEKIAVYGDFDADGITATAVMVKGLKAIGGQVSAYIPHRVSEGHGLKTAALDKLRQQGISLVITVDCGITALSEARKAARTGLDIIITDHHTPLEELPEGIAVIDPRRKDSEYPFTELAGVGVAYKLIQALYRSMGKEDELEDLLDLVAIGTVADMMPLLGENRYFVSYGLQALNTKLRPGLQELFIQARLKEEIINPDSISWVIAPRLNAAGRLDHALPGFQLLMTESVNEARELASCLEAKNAERQKLTTRFQEKARQKILSEDIAPLLYYADTECPIGILGLVAGRLTDEFYHPSIAVRIGKETSAGSCRSIPEFNINNAVTRCRNLLSQFGGHAQAAGFSLPTEKLAEFVESISQIAEEELTGVELRPHLEIDAEVRLSELTGDTFSTIQKLAPFGSGNPSPIFLSRGVRVIGCQQIGNNGQHLKMKVKQGDTLWNAIAFRLGESISKVLNQPLDFVYNLELNYWRGVETIRLNILDFTPSNHSDS